MVHLDFLLYFLLLIYDIILPNILLIKVNELNATSGNKSLGYATLIYLIPTSNNSIG